MKRKILIADDEPEYVASLKRYLEDHGYEVSTEQSGFKVINKVREGRPDLVIVDVFFHNTDNADGMDVVQSIEEDPVLGRTPVVISTAFMSEDLVASQNSELASSGSMKRYLVKAGRPEAVLELIGELMGK